MIHKQEINKKRLVLRILNIGQRIRTIRWILKLSQGDFAGKIGAGSYLTVLRYEKNLTKPDIAKISRIAALGHTTEKWIITGEVNIQSCNQLINSIKEKKMKYSTIAHDLNIPVGFLSLIEIHKLQPSENLIKKYCDTYKIDEEPFFKILLNGENYGIENLYKSTKATPEKNVTLEKIDEISSLLLQDDSAIDIVLKLLRGRQAIDNAITDLKSPIKKSSKDT